MSTSRILIFCAGVLLLASTLTACAKNRSEIERMEAAYQSFEIGENRPALIELKNLLQINPANKEARLLLARTSIKLGDPQSAEKELDRASELGASADETYVLRLQALLMQGRHKEVASDFDASALTIPENQEIAKVFYGNAKYGSGNDAAARALYNEVIASGSSQEARRMALLGLADVSRKSKELDKALEYAEQALALNPESSESIVAIGQVQLGLENYVAAHSAFIKIRSSKLASTNERFLAASGEADAALGMEDLEAADRAAIRLEQLAPDNPISLYLRARVANAEGDKEIAYNLIQKVLSRYPNFRPAQLMHGALSLERQEFDQARMFLGSVVAAQPGNKDARKLLAETLLQLNKPEEAARILREAMAAGIADSQMVGMLGRANLQLDDKDASILELKRSLETDPGNADLQLALAAAYVSAGKTGEAVALFDNIDGSKEDSKRRDLLLLLAAMQDKDMDALRQQSERIQRLWPEDVQALHLVGGAYFSMGELSTARQIFERIESLAPDDANVLTNLGRIDLAQNKYAAAVERYQAFIKRNPEHQLAQLSLSYVYQSQGEEQLARQTIESAYNIDPANEVTANVFARFLINEKDYTKAAEVVSAIIADNPKSASAYYTRASVAEAQKRHKEALDALVMADSLDPENLTILRAKARNEILLLLSAQARATFAKIRELDSSDMVAARSLALLELKAQSPGRVEAVLDSLLAEFPDDSNTYAVIGDVRRHAKDNDAALEAYRKSYAIKPTRRVMLSIYGMTAKDSAAAIDVLNNWLELSPEDTSARLLIAQRLQGLGKADEAKGQYERVLAQSPDNALALNNLAWLYFEQPGASNSAQAVSLAKQAYELQSETAAIVDTYGWILFRSGDVEGGKTMLAKAESLSKSDGDGVQHDIVYHYSVALSETGEKTQARNRLQQIVDSKVKYASREEAESLLESLKR